MNSDFLQGQGSVSLASHIATGCCHTVTISHPKQLLASCSEKTNGECSEQSLTWVISVKILDLFFLHTLETLHNLFHPELLYKRPMLIAEKLAFGRFVK